MSYRAYTNEQMTAAFQLCREGTSVYKAAKLTGVPEQTLRDRTCGHIATSVTHSGPAPLLSVEEEMALVTHVKEMASYGYGYTRAELINLATDTAVFLEKKEKEDKSLEVRSG